MISRLIQGWQAILLLALIAFILIPVFTWSSFKDPPEMCDAEVSLLNVSVHLDDGQRFERISVEFPKEEPIEVKPDDTIALIAEIKPRPEGCNGPFLVSWRLPFSSGSSPLEFISEASRQQVLKVTVNAPVPKDYSEGQITITVVRILSGTKEQMQTLRFKVKGE